MFRRIPVLLAIALLLSSCARQSAPPAAAGNAAKRPGTPVRAASASRQDVPLEVRAIGNVEAISSVAIKSRVAGQLLRVHIRDGQDITKGQLLFEIDAVPFEEQLRLAEANLARNAAAEKQTQASIARDRAQARNARAQADRYLSLQKEGIVSRDQTEQFTTAAEAAEASLNAEQASLESVRASMRADDARVADAKLHLGYTKIYAPMAGRAGAVAVKEGNLVKENDTTLVSILQVTPVYVSFAVPENALSSIRRNMTLRKLLVEAVSEGSAEPPVTGTLDFIDNTVDATTGTIKLKATFSNVGFRLWPGQFVNVNLNLATERSVVTVPAQAVQNRQAGQYVWVVKPDMTAELRPVVLARTRGDLAVVAEGLMAGENVVTEGQLRVTPGAKLDVMKPSIRSAQLTGEARP